MMQVKRIDPRENTNYTGSVATQSRPISSTNSPHPTINRASSFFGLKDSNLEEPSAQIVLEKRVETLK